MHTGNSFETIQFRASDAYGRFTKIPENVQIGQFLVPFSKEHCHYLPVLGGYIHFERSKDPYMVPKMSRPSDSNRNSMF